MKGALLLQVRFATTSSGESEIRTRGAAKPYTVSNRAPHAIRILSMNSGVCPSSSQVPVPCFQGRTHSRYVAGLFDRPDSNRQPPGFGPRRSAIELRHGCLIRYWLS
jgi:hypothetical protein